MLVHVYLHIYISILLHLYEYLLLLLLHIIIYETEYLLYRAFKPLLTPRQLYNYYKYKCME